MWQLYYVSSRLCCCVASRVRARAQGLTDAGTDSGTVVQGLIGWDGTQPTSPHQSHRCWRYGIGKIGTGNEDSCVPWMPWTELDFDELPTVQIRSDVCMVSSGLRNVRDAAPEMKQPERFTAVTPDPLRILGTVWSPLLALRSAPTQQPLPAMQAWVDLEYSKNPILEVVDTTPLCSGNTNK